jgi:hypothetical protein
MKKFSIPAKLTTKITAKKISHVKIGGVGAV